jgi:hypothetical protein
MICSPSTLWPSWVKGGLAGSAIAVASILISAFCAYTGGVIAASLALMPVMPIYLLVDYFLSTSSPIVVYWLAGIIVWFMIGVVLSSIGGYLESRQINK